MLKWFVAIFIAVFIAGLLLPRLGRWLPLGRLPGDVSLRWRGRDHHFPFATTLVLSLLLGLLLRYL